MPRLRKVEAEGEAVFSFLTADFKSLPLFKFDFPLPHHPHARAVAVVFQVATGDCKIEMGKQRI